MDIEALLMRLASLVAMQALSRLTRKSAPRVLVECAILQHVVDCGQQRGRHCDGSLFGSASSFEAEELCLIWRPGQRVPLSDRQGRCTRRGGPRLVGPLSGVNPPRQQPAQHGRT